MNQFGHGKIVTNGLVLYLDAADLMSYTGSDANWYDLCGNKKIQTLIASPTFDGKQFTFDGATQGVSGSLAYSPTSSTIVIWMNSTSTASAWARGNLSNTYYLASSSGDGNYYYSNCGGGTSTYVDLQYPVSQSYMDGYYHMFEAKNVDLSSWTSLEWFLHPLLRLAGNVSSILVYNRTLTVSESMRNYNMQKTRYSISSSATSNILGGVDGFTGLMLHMSGSKDSTTITDSCTRPKTNLTVVGNAKITSSVIKFGIFGYGSAYFTGSAPYINIPYTPDIDFGISNFTIDFWFNSTQGNKVQATFYSCESVNNGLSISMNTSANSSDGKIQSWAVSGGTVLYSALTTTTGGYNDGNWHHVALVRNITDVQIYVDGTSRAQASVSATNGANSAANASIGYNIAYTPREYWGYITEFRISKGIARWTGSFTPPTRPYCAG